MRCSDVIESSHARSLMMTLIDIDTGSLLLMKLQHCAKNQKNPLSGFRDLYRTYVHTNGGVVRNLPTACRLPGGTVYPQHRSRRRLQRCADHRDHQPAERDMELNMHVSGTSSEPDSAVRTMEKMNQLRTRSPTSSEALNTINWRK